MHDDLRTLLTTLGADPAEWAVDEDGDACLLGEDWRLDVHRHAAAGTWLLCLSSDALPGLAINWTIADRGLVHAGWVVEALMSMLLVALSAALEVRDA